jgi:glutamate N-acetyltransferase / amino-acid N-acetyltransferase
VSKSAALRVALGGGKHSVTVGGMCKGSGMIHPNMATMLGVVTCDAAVTPEVWRPMVKRASTASFNQITVCMLAGNQTTGVKPHVQQLPTAGS